MSGARPAIVIVGAGDCGTRAAFTLREEGWDGQVILVGAEPSLPYERPPLSKTWELKPSCDDGALRDAGITLLAGTEATGLEVASHVLELAGGDRLEYRSLLLATGGRARRLPFGGARASRSARCSSPAARSRTRLRSPIPPSRSRRCCAPLWARNGFNDLSAAPPR